MKPMNDTIRKQAYTRAGFFTLIPMFIVGVLVWSGMKNGSNLRQVTSEEVEILKDSIASVNKILAFTTTVQNSFIELMDKRDSMERVFKKAFITDSLNVTKEEGDLVSAEQEIREYLNQQRKNIPKHESSMILDKMLTQFQYQSELKKKLRSNFIGNKNDSVEDDNITELEDEIENLKDKLKLKSYDNRDSKTEIRDLKNKYEDEKEEVKYLKEENRKLQRKHDKQVANEKEFLQNISDDLDEINCPRNCRKKVECLSNIINLLKGSVNSRRNSIND